MKPITQESDRLGFIGVGYMGRPIARRLLEAGFKLTVSTETRTRRTSFGSKGWSPVVSGGDVSVIAVEMTHDQQP